MHTRGSHGTLLGIPEVTRSFLRYILQGSHGTLSGMTVLYSRGHMELLSGMYTRSHMELSGMYTRGHMELSDMYSRGHIELSQVCTPGGHMDLKCVLQESYGTLRYVSDVHHWSCGALSGITRSGTKLACIILWEVFTLQFELYL